MKLKNLLLSFLITFCSGEILYAEEVTSKELNKKNTKEKQFLQERTNKISIHIVQKGDTLSSLSRQYSIKKDILMKLNNLKDEDYIFIGQNLRIKVNGLLSAEDSDIPKDNFHLIKEGENLTEISNKYDLNLKRLIELNKINNPNKLKVGTKLILREEITMKNEAKYGPLVIKSEKLELKYGRKILETIHQNGEDLIIAVKCNEKAIDVRKTWKSNIQ